MGISASTGITSGIDYASLIEGLIKIERQPITLMENRQSRLETSKSALSTLSSKLKELQSAADALKSTTSFNVFKTSVSDETVFTASASSSASAGNYTIKVNLLAKNHQIVSTGVADKDATLIAAGAGSFKFTVGSGAVQTVNVDATTTMQKLADDINALSAGATASIVNTGTEYKLILKSNETGTSNSLAITQNDTTLTTSDLQTAQNASITVDGLTVTRSSNTITDVIGGVTINLLKVGSAAGETLTVTRDTDSIKTKITDLVDKYNSVMTYINENNKYDSKTKTKGSLYGEAVAKTVMEQMRQTIQSTISGLSNPDMNELREAGISIDSKGKLSVDSTKLSDALSTKFNDVVNLFATGSTTGFGALIYDAIDIFTNADGSITKRTTGYDNTIKSLDKAIEQKESKLDAYAETLRIRFAALESMVTSLRNQQNYLAGALGRY
ncbi:MAG: flagellar filament capping protein FliD [Deltaproteobacteria bacterium]|nr:flagellar filament capping protein FliD [Deltaproteobacteria bacterium]